MFPGNELQDYPKFTKREKIILELVAKGWTNQKIAEICSLSIDSIDRIIGNIYFKLEITYINNSIKNRRILATRYVFLTRICEKCFENLVQ